jgi:hypothetical protein
MVEFFVAVLLIALSARLVAGWVAKRWAPVPGRIEARMPGPAPAVRDGGTPAARFDAELARVAERLARDPQTAEPDVEAGRLAARLGEDPEIVAAVFERWRARWPCRLKVTASGRLLHTFARADLARDRRQRAFGHGYRALRWLVVALANVGATWPLVASLAIVGGAFAVLVDTASDATVPAWLVALVALGLTGAALVANLGLGWLIGRVLARPGPQMRDAAHAPDTETQAIVDAGAPGLTPAARRQQQAAAVRHKIANRVARPVRADTGRGHGKVRGWLGDLVEMVPSALFESPTLVLIGLLVAVAVLSVAGIAVWMRGLWRSVARPAWTVDVAPGDWVRDGQREDPLEAVVPTSDLVAHVMFALRTDLGRARPRDPRQVERVSALAARNRGWVSQLDVQLTEGLGPGAAVSLLAVWALRHGGALEVRAGGTVDAWSPDVGRVPDAVPDAPTECLAHARDRSPVAGVRVAIAGLTWGHVRGADRLAAGTTGLAVAATAWLGDGAPALVSWLLPAAAVAATWGLAAVLRGVVAARAQESVLRDVRRASLAEVQAALAGGIFDTERLAADLRRTLRPAWPDLPLAAVHAEVQAVCAELDLEPVASPHGSAVVWSLAALSARLAVCTEQRPATRAAADDEVVFDTGTLTRFHG